MVHWVGASREEGRLKKELVVEVPGLTVWYCPDERFIHHEMSRYPGAAVLESALDAGLEALRAHRASKWLSDDRRGGALPKSHHEWGQNVWGPKAAAAGWKYWALLPPTEMLGTTNMLRLVEIYAALGVKAKTFGDLQSAIDWLVTCP